MKTAAAYIRVSTDDQIEYSPESQIKKIREYAQKNDILLLEDHIYTDEGISGKRTANRQGFNLMIGTAKQKPKPFDLILVWKFSRFARNREDSIVYKSMLRKQCDIQVVSVSEDIGDDKTSVLIEALIEAMDEYYSINLAEEVRRGMLEKVSRGGAVCRPPIGYTMKDGKIYPNDDAALVRAIFMDFVNGTGYRALAHKYASLGLKTTKGNPPDNRCIEYIIRNPIYAGKIRWCKDGRGAGKRDFFNKNNLIVDGIHDAIVSPELFELAQERADRLKLLYSSRQQSDEPKSYMLKGLVRCSACGSTLTLLSLKCPSLQCHSYSRGTCRKSHSIALSKINQSVITYLTEVAANGNFDIVQKRKASSIDFSNDLEKILKNETVKLNRAKIAYIDGIDTKEEYASNKMRIQKEIDRLRAAIARQEASFPKIDKNAFCDKITNVLNVVTNPDASEDSKNKSLRTVIDHVTYHADTKSIDVVFYTL